MPADRPVTAYIGIGSNIEPERHVADALERLRRATCVRAISTFYWTAPIHRPRQPPFLNGACRIEARTPALALKFDLLRGIESDLGRVRTDDAYAARTIDLDILLYGDLVLDDTDLVLPDPGIRTRAFIAVPLLELEPALVLPDTGEPLASVAAALDHGGLEPATGITECLRADAGQR